tara:strand:- start:312 stop:599 length:288 start_codon:yes stop_codon:yes gene_type:complete
MKKIKKKFNFFSVKDNKFNFKNCTVKVKNYNSLEEIIKRSQTSTIHTLIEGNIINNLNNPVVPLGDIIKNGTIKKMAKEFKVKKKIRVFSVFNKK